MEKFKLPDGTVVDAQTDSLLRALEHTLTPLTNLTNVFGPNDGEIDAGAAHLLLERLRSLARDELCTIARVIHSRIGRIELIYRPGDLRTIYDARLITPAERTVQR